MNTQGDSIASPGATALGMVLMLAVGTALHEGGHALTALALGARLEQIGVMPGVQFYPELGIIPWRGAVGFVRHTELAEAWMSGLTKMMGSGTTAIAAYGALLLLRGAARGTASRRVALFAALLFVWDGLAYVVFPALGLPHWIIIGGRQSEPMVAAQMMGLDPTLFLMGVGAHAAAFHALLWRIWRGQKERPHSSKSVLH